jgi:hypothetical protein
MKGHILKVKEDWVVSYDYDQQILLHPDDVQEIKKLSQIFDNIGARILSQNIVDFELVMSLKSDKVHQYAKLKNFTSNF